MSDTAFKKMKRDEAFTAIERAASELRKRRPELNLSEAQSIAQVMADDPSLYSAYREHMA